MSRLSVSWRLDRLSWTEIRTCSGLPSLDMAGFLAVLSGSWKMVAISVRRSKCCWGGGSKKNESETWTRVLTQSVADGIGEGLLMSDSFEIAMEVVPWVNES